MNALKPCPFCGREAVLVTKHHYLAYFVECANEQCFASVRGDSELEVLLAWNTRPIEDELQKRIAELEADNKKAFDLVRKFGMYCIWANWDNPDTEDEFNEFDVEVCKWLSKFMEREE